MPNTAINHARIVSLIWGIADDVLRDLYVRVKYRDVILPFTVLRRLDSVLEPIPMPTLTKIQADIWALEAESDDLMAEIVGGKA